MISKENYILLDQWCMYYSNQIEQGQKAYGVCLSCGIAAIVLSELPPNHEIYHRPIGEALISLWQLVQDYIKEVKK